MSLYRGAQEGTMGKPGSYGDQGRRSAAQSATNHRLELRGIAVALDLDRGSCAFDLGEIGSGQLDGRCADILLQAMELRSAWDRDDPRALRPARRARAEPGWRSFRARSASAGRPAPGSSASLRV